MTTSRMPTEMAALARRVVSAMSVPAWRQGKVQVALEAAEPEIWAMADEQRLLQALGNLLHGAVRRTLPGGVVAVSVESQPGAVVIRVRDTGEDVQPDDVSCIWQLAEAAGGAVAVESVPGGGNCCSITLPRAGSQRTD